MWTYLDSYFVKAINDHLLNSKTTINDLALSADIKPSNLVRILNHNYSPPLYIYERLFNVLGIQVHLVYKPDMYDDDSIPF